ncbi:MAG: hypothetical protein OXF41_11725 [bacterium]|nr:hypothetical protein [bacterium]
MFREVSTRSILGKVPTNLQGEVARSLWRRINSEFEFGGPSAVTSYLRAQFGEIESGLRDDLKAAKNGE